MKWKIWNVDGEAFFVETDVKTSGPYVTILEASERVLDAITLRAKTFGPKVYFLEAKVS